MTRTPAVALVALCAVSCLGVSAFSTSRSAATTRSPRSKGAGAQSKPSLLYMPPAIAPEGRAGGDTVVVHALVGADGLITQAKVVHSVPDLDAKALGVVRESQWRPALVGGAFVARWVDVPVRFVPADSAHTSTASSNAPPHAASTARDHPVVMYYHPALRESVGVVETTYPGMTRSLGYATMSFALEPTANGLPDVISPPALLWMPAPPLSSARSATGTPTDVGATVLAMIDTDGRVLEAKVIAAPPDIEDAARVSVGHSLWKPGVNATGKAISQWVRVSLRIRQP